MQHDTAGTDSTGTTAPSTGAVPTSGPTSGDESTGVTTGTTTTGVMPETSTSGGSTTTTGDPDTTGAPGTTTTTTTTTGEPDTTDEPNTSDEPNPTSEPGECCFVPVQPNSTIQAKTPVGDRALSWASFSRSSGECGGSLTMNLFPQVAGVGVTWSELNNIDHMFISVTTYDDMWPDDFLGTGPASVEATFDGQSAQVDGQITITKFNDKGIVDNSFCGPGEPPVDPDARVKFKIALKAVGWDITGEVEAQYCPTLNNICP